MLMKRRKSVYVDGSVWEVSKLLIKYINNRDKNNFDLSDVISNFLKEWSDKEMQKLEKSNPEAFRRIKVTAFEKEKAAKKLDSVFKENNLKEIFNNNDE
jgi:hypothetical protein